MNNAFLKIFSDCSDNLSKGKEICKIIDGIKTFNGCARCLLIEPINSFSKVVLKYLNNFNITNSIITPIRIAVIVTNKFQSQKGHSFAKAKKSFMGENIIDTVKK